MQSTELHDLFKKYSNFHGVANRREYWYTVLVTAAAGFLGSLCFLSMGGLFGQFSMTLALLAMVVWGVLMAWMALATTARRCRDAGFNPWLCLTIFIPYLGWLAVVIFGVVETKAEVPV